MAKAKSKSAPAKKGVAGIGTGGKARAAISKAKSRGATSKTIGRATGRDESTINNIASGNIKNPPKNLAGNVSKAKKGKKK